MIFRSEIDLDVFGGDPRVLQAVVADQMRALLKVTQSVPDIRVPTVDGTLFLGEKINTSTRKTEARMEVLDNSFNASRERTEEGEFMTLPALHVEKKPKEIKA